MKKILSSVLMAAMLIMMFSSLAFAATTEYVYTYEAAGTFPSAAIVVKANAAATNGYVSLKLDATKVKLFAFINTGSAWAPSYSMVEITSENASTYAGGTGCVLNANGNTVVEEKISIDSQYIQIVTDWMAPGGSSAASGAEIIRYFIAPVESTDNWDATTISTAADSAWLTANNKLYGSALLMVDGVSYKQSDDTLGVDDITYPNSDVTVGGGEPAEDEWKKDEESTVGTVTFPTALVDDAVTETATSGARTQIAVFGKNVTGHELADGDYWVQFNENKYLGKASEGVVTAWAIVIVDTTGEKMEAGREYSYTAGCGEQSWTGTVTVAEIAE